MRAAGSSGAGPASRLRASLLACALALLAAHAPRAAAQASVRAVHCPPGAAPRACYQGALRDALAALGERGDGVAGARLQFALHRLRESCRDGLGDACYFAGRLTVTAVADSLAHLAELDGTVMEALRRAEATATDLYLHGCRHAAQPSGAACSGAGNSFDYGIGRRADADSALAYFGLGCRLQNATACGREGTLLANRADVGPDPITRAEERSREACARGSPMGCGNLARIADYRLRVGGAGPPGAGEAEHAVTRAYREACRKRRLLGCSDLGTLFESGRLGVRQDADSARHYHELACRGRGSGNGSGPGAWLGVGYACTRLARLSLRAEPPDSSAALKYYRIGCALFHSLACIEAGPLARKPFGPGGAVYAQLFVLATACAEGYRDSCAAAGREYETELDDTVQAADFYRQSCELGWGEGCADRGDLALKGGDPRTAVKYHRRACAAGSGRGCTSLGALLAGRFAEGARAARLFAMGCGLGSAEGCWRAMLDARERGDEAAEGESRARACRLDAAYCNRAQPGDEEAGPAAGAPRPGPATLIAPGREVRATLEPDSPPREWLYSARAGERLTVELRSAEFDTYLRVGYVAGCASPDAACGPAGAFRQVASNDDADGSDSRVRITADSARDYVIRAGAFESGAGGAYTLRVDSRPPVVRALQVGSIHPGEEVAGTLEDTDAPHDLDGSPHDHWIYRGAQPGETLVVTLRSTEFDPLLSFGVMEEGRFRELSLNDDAPSGEPGVQVSRVVAMVTRAGDYVIRVNTFGPEERGAYTLRVERGR